MQPTTERTPAPHSWPMSVAVLSLVLLAILIPIAAMLIAFAASFTIWGEVSPERAADSYHAVLVGAISGGLAVVGGVVAVVAGRGVAVRIVAACALLIGLFTGGVHTLFALSYQRSITPVAVPQQPPAPTCGPDSHPAVFGGDSRYTACPDDLATATDLLDEVLPQLPTTDVTVASVTQVASQLHPDVYDQAVAFDNGDIVVAWYPAPVTCATALWRDGAWQPQPLGMLAEGGCIYVGG
jgi:hypothetical protein